MLGVDNVRCCCDTVDTLDCVRDRCGITVCISAVGGDKVAMLTVWPSGIEGGY